MLVRASSGSHRCYQYNTFPPACKGKLLLSASFPALFPHAAFLPFRPLFFHGDPPYSWALPLCTNRGWGAAFSFSGTLPSPPCVLPLLPAWFAALLHIAPPYKPEVPQPPLPFPVRCLRRHSSSPAWFIALLHIAPPFKPEMSQPAPLFRSCLLRFPPVSLVSRFAAQQPVALPRKNQGLYRSFLVSPSIKYCYGQAGA